MRGTIPLNNPVWVKLNRALAELALWCKGDFAFVIDVGKCLWCVGFAPLATLIADDAADDAAHRFYEKEMVPRIAGMRRGKPLDVAKFDGEDRYAARSFASIYAAVVWSLRPDLEQELVPAKIRRSLPEIEALTLALPPSGRPGADGGARKLRA